MRGFNPVREGYYEDQAFTYADELTRRISTSPRALTPNPEA